MHDEEGEEDLGGIAAYYGILPTIAGLAFAAGLIWFMFEVADGFA